MPDDAPAAPAAAPTVLVVEDEALVAMRVADTLDGAGYGPVWSPDGSAAAAAAAAAVVDLRLADGLDGREVVRRLRGRRPGLPVVVVTGSAPPGGAEALRRGGGGHGPLVLLHKPLDFAALGEAVRRVTAPAPAPAPAPASAPTP